MTPDIGAMRVQHRKVSLPMSPWGHKQTPRGVRPGSWTVSCGGFDSLPGVVILELCWA